MLGSPRIGIRPLAELCRRNAVALTAGLDVRRVWAREAQAARGAARKPFTVISQHINEGDTLAEGIADTGEYFPVLFRELAAVGEEGGRLAEVFRQLSEHYEHQVVMRRNFVRGLTWPMFQLGIALCVVGLLIWVMGFIAKQNNSAPLDLLGLGLFGTDGLVKYLMFLGVVAAVLFAIYRAIARGRLWIRPVQHALMRVPKLGRCLQTLALSRLAWSMHVTMDAGMDLRKAIALSFRSTHNAYYTSHLDQVLADIRRGEQIYEALTATGVFPRDFLDAFEVGEQSGRLTESLAVLSRQYQDEGRSALNTLAIIAGFLVWSSVAVMIVVIIFRIFNTYVGILNDASKM